VILLRLFLKRSVKIIVQHHGEQPFRGIKKQLQKIAGKCTDAWLFTSIGNAQKWIDQKIIPQSGSCYELPEASTSFKRLSNKSSIKNELGIIGNQNFLWVGRLNENKDPLTVVNGFAHFAAGHTEAVLYMIFQEQTLLDDITKMIKQENIKNQVVLVGSKPHDELEKWFNAADFYISGSWQEGSGYALIEAIACGCIPVVTDIPPFRKLTANGSLGFLYPPGHSIILHQQLKKAVMVDRRVWAEDLVAHFHKNLSFKKIARELDRICHKTLSTNKSGF
jgi:glycosyltransferase involved in cell wall biosynthesis